jgi:hypothetical protein
MRQLTVYARLMEPASPEGNAGSLVRVYWRTGLKGREALDVALPPACADPESAAEMAAIRHLLGVKEVLGPNVMGRGVQITCSKGAVKKVARGTSAKAGLFEYGYPLLTRYADAQYKVSKNAAWIREPFQAERIDAASQASGVEVIETLSLGPVGITLHALERYLERGVEGLSASAGWRSLARRLDSGLEPVGLPEKVARHKLKKYGHAQTETRKHPTDPLHFLFSLERGGRKLLTVFNALPEW